MIQVLIVDDHTLMRELLVDELNEIEDIQVAGDVSTGEEALSRLAQIRPDIVLMDISLPGKDGIEISAEIRARGITIPILCLTMHLNNHILRRALQAGVNGYALKHDAFEDLVTGIRAVVDGKRYISPILMPGETGETGEPGEPGETGEGQDSILDDTRILNKLLPRERQVVTLIAGGRTSAEMADILAISERTIDFHRRNVIEKTGLNRIADITRFAVRAGLSVDM